MRWFSDPQRDTRDDIRASHQALVHAGYSRSRAMAEVTIHLHRVRAALAAPRDIVSAGLLVGAAVAVVLTLALGVAWFVMNVAAGPGMPAGNAGTGYYLVGGASNPATPAGPTTDPSEASPASLLDILPAALTAVAILSLAGAGMALVTRNRWRRAGALDTFIDVAPRRRYLLEAAAVWLVVAALIVLIVRTQAGPQMADGAVVMLAFFGIPVLASVFAAAFPSLYSWFLPRVSPLDAAAYARPIIELEAARRVKAEHEAAGPGAHHRDNYERRVWLDEVLARLDASNTARRRR